MKHFFVILIIVMLSPIPAEAQMNYSGRVETGYQQYSFRTITVDPGPNWKAYNLNEKQDGFNFTTVNGVTFNNRKLFTGIGLGYLKEYIILEVYLNH